MGVRGMHARGKEADQRERLGLGQRLARPQPEALAEIGQNGGVLGQRLAIVEPQRGHAPLRVDLEVGFRALLAAGQVHFLRLIFLAALFQHDVRGHRARPRGVIERHHRKTLLVDAEIMSSEKARRR